MKNRLILASALLAGATHAAHAGQATLQFGADTVRIDAQESASALRRYKHSTTAALRDGAPQTTEYAELDGLPRVRSGNVAFDALFALAVAEMKQDSVAAIRDASYNGGQPIACECFETGEQWHYVWTRDLSYAAGLGLAMLDPQRVRNSLLFKLSGYRGAKPAAAAGSADGLQVVQDTGSGGSWPVSTDRVSWAFGAEAALKSLPDAERAAFEPVALKALSNTIENDRLAAFDTASGLYRGEQSFLDWREQSYAAWIPGDIASLATSSALSTNVAHYKALTLAAELARRAKDDATAQRYDGWAVQLKDAINARLWLADAGMYSSLTAGHFDGAPLHKFDWLGQSLAVLTGVADAEQARSIMARYPHGPLGAPVIWPQQPGVPVYHNRALWPFVTGYGLRAAVETKNVAVADAAYASLVRGAALNMSNMENMEWLSGHATPPVVNSRRQLWSVAAYLGMVVEQVFGVSVSTERLNLRPFITSRLRREQFSGSDEIVLSGLVLHGKRVQVKIALPPPVDIDGQYSVIAGTLNGQALREAPRWTELAEDNVFELKLGALMPGRQQITRIAADAPASATTAPAEPASATAASTAATQAAPGVKILAHRIGNCTTLEAVNEFGLHSHHSAPACEGAQVSGDVRHIDLPRDGRQHIQFSYSNAAHKINLGITNGVKWLSLRDQQGAVAAQGIVQFPHAVGKAWSTPLTADLKRGRYTLELADFTNMSYLQSNASYADAGGVQGPRNEAELHAVRSLPAAAAPAPASKGKLELVEHFKSPQLGNERTLRIYLPPGYDTSKGKRYPVLYMHDGQNLFDARTAAYGTEWNIDEVADRLVAQGKMEEVIVVGIDNTPDRIGEYTPCCDPKHGGGKLKDYSAFIVNTLKPWVDSHYRTKPQREHTAIMGSSLGGIASVHIAQHYPQVFSKAGGVSSSFWWNNGDFVKHPPKHLPVKFYIDAGTAMDGLEATDEFRKAMLKRGYRQGKDFYFLADEGGIHNEQSWASRVHVPLAWFFPKR